jgi:hypothetical protein
VVPAAPPPAPVAEVAPAAQPVAAAQDEPPAAVSMPVASATVTAMDPGEVAAIRAARPAGDVASASLAVRQ